MAWPRGGGGRIDHKPFGVHGAWVNGERVVDENGSLAKTPLAGQVLREFA
jgi:hypothetical protein